MINDIEPILKVKRVKLRLQKRMTTKGMYYRELTKRIENPKKKKINNNEENDSNTEAHREGFTGEGSFLDKLVWDIVL